jgi:hypothetical protein
MAAPASDTAGAAPVQTGDIFWGPSSKKARSQGIATNLEGLAFSHMVLVLGPLSVTGCWRIMTVCPDQRANAFTKLTIMNITTDAQDYDTSSRSTPCRKVHIQRAFTFAAPSNSPRIRICA